MMDILRDWLLGIVGAAMILSLADALTPEGTVKRIGKLTGGLLLMIAILRPILAIDYNTISANLADYRFEAQQYDNSLEVENVHLKKIIIEDRTGAYIQDKAAELGIVCTAEVVCHVDENDMPFPASVVIRGHIDEDEIRTMTRLIEGEIAISPEDQYYERISEP